MFSSKIERLLQIILGNWKTSINRTILLTVQNLHLWSLNSRVGDVIFVDNLVIVLLNISLKYLLTLKELNFYQILCLEFINGCDFSIQYNLGKMDVYHTLSRRSVPPTIDCYVLIFDGLTYHVVLLMFHMRRHHLSYREERGNKRIVMVTARAHSRRYN